MSTEKFEQNVKMLAKKAVGVTGDESDRDAAENLLRCFDSQTIDILKTFIDCCEKISKKIEDL